MRRIIFIARGAGGLFLLSPVLVVLIRRQMGASVLFCQTRPGRGGRPFRMVKSRTMRDAQDAAGNTLPDAEGLARLGRFLLAKKAQAAVAVEVLVRHQRPWNSLV